MRSRFDEQLELLNVELIKMGALCEEAITAAVKALSSDDGESRARVFEADAAIDRKEKEIEAICMRLMIRQQPVASDFRFISAALKMVSDMERIGDQAADIAEITKFVTVNGQSGNVHIDEMASATIKMVTDSINSFVRRDLSLAREVIKYDDIVDGLFIKVRLEIIGLIAKEPDKGEDCIDLFMIAKYFERIGDHATNIAEWVEFSITGEYKGERL